MTPKQKCIEDMILAGAESAHLIRILRTEPKRISEQGFKLRVYAASGNWDRAVTKYRKLTRKAKTK